MSKPNGRHEDIKCLGLAIDNVPSIFTYWALGQLWFLCHPAQVKYNPVSSMHTFFSCTRDFVAFFGCYLATILDKQAALGQDPNYQCLCGGISVDPGVSGLDGPAGGSNCQIQVLHEEPMKLIIQLLAVQMGPAQAQLPRGAARMPT